jgi:hypothetical protein
MTTAQCRECPLTYELTPPADADFKTPKENKPTSGEYLERVYECESGHRNTIYWVKKPAPFFMRLQPD